MRKWHYIVTIISLLIIAVVRAETIAAIVDDVPISFFDVTTRARLLLLQQGQDIKKISEEVKKEALETLIEEQIKRRILMQKGIKVSADEVSKAILHLEKQNGMQPNTFRNVLKQNQIPTIMFEKQVQTDLGWLQIVQQASSKDKVRKEDISARRDMIRKELAKESLHFAEIVLPDEETALAVWADLNKGTPFREIAEEKSISDTRSRGGEVVDATRFYYGKDVAPVLVQMLPGQLSRPIKVPNGYALILMIGKREAITTDTVPVWDLMQAVVVSGSSVDQTLSVGQLRGCDSFAGAVSKIALSDTVRRGQVSPSQLPPEIKDILAGADIGKSVGPIQTPEGSLYFMKCDSKEVSVVPDEETIRGQIEMERIDQVSKRLLAEARRDAVIEYK